MSKKRKIILVVLCVCFSLLCILADPGVQMEPKGVFMLALTSFCFYRVLFIKRRKNQRETD